MDWYKLLNSFKKPAFLLKHNKIALYNEIFENLGHFDTKKDFFEVFHFFENISGLTRLPINLECIYKRNSYKFVSTELNNDEYEYIIFLEQITKSLYFEPNDEIAKLFHIGYIIIYFDQDKNFSQINVSPNILERFGIEDQPLTIKKFASLFTVEDYKNLVEKFQSVYGTNQQFDFIINPFITRKGTLNIYSRGYYDNSDGNPKIILSTINFTEIKTILYSEQALKTIFYDNNDPIFIVNEDLQIQKMNLAAQKNLKELGIEFIEGSNVSEICHLDNFERDLQYFRNKLVQEKTILLKNGMYVDIEVNTIPITFDNKPAVIAIVHNVTETRKLAKRIIEEQAKFKEIVNSAYDAIIMLDENANIEFWNKAAENIFGYTFSELSGKPITCIFQDKNSINKFNFHFQSDIIKELQQHPKQIKILTKSNTEITIDVNITSFEFENKIKYVAIVREISEILKIKQELEKTNEALRRFISILSHDLRTPFTQIMSFYEILDNDFIRKSPEKTIEIFNLLKNSSQNGLQLLDQLLQWGRAINNNVIYNPTAFPINHAINQTIELINATAINKQIEIEYLQQSDCIQVNADYNMVLTILNNLLSNAIKFSFPNSKIVISTTNSNIFCHICVKDFGIGMNQEQIENLFNIAKTKPTFGTAQEKGSGLGLLFVKDLIGFNNGKIWVISKPNEGTEIHFTLLKSLKL